MFKNNIPQKSQHAVKKAPQRWQFHLSCLQEKTEIIPLNINSKITIDNIYLFYDSEYYVLCNFKFGNHHSWWRIMLLWIKHILSICMLVCWQSITIHPLVFPCLFFGVPRNADTAITGLPRKCEKIIEK